MRSDRAILSPTFVELARDEPVVLVDVGARGELEEPWRLMDPGALRVIGFEPDGDECARLAHTDPTRRYLPVALWSTDVEVDVHVAAFPGCTSVHPPNAEVLERYAPEHVEPRATTAVARYPARRLDDVLREEGIVCDVVKIDTQGSEGEVIAGAAEVLRRDAFAVLVETWTVEVHRGQALTGDVMRELASLGFSVFDIGVAAAWTRRAATGADLVAKRQVTGLDLLVFKDPPPDGSIVQRAKWAAIADAFGFTDYALEILAGNDSSEGEAMRAALVRGAMPAGPAARRGLLRRRASVPHESPFASLHA
ncbi:MAG TPA: FkbM family methyltransferase [Solirubrobacteraceae bacterium]